MSSAEKIPALKELAILFLVLASYTYTYTYIETDEYNNAQEGNTHDHTTSSSIGSR